MILGLGNFNLREIMKAVQAAEIGGATYIDIAANVEILKEIKAISTLPICVSSIDIDELCCCFRAGADILEIGNFDIFYAKGISFSKKQVFDLTSELKYKAPNASICVTIPHTLPLEEQITLAQQVEGLGIDLLQTEGISSHIYLNNDLLNSVENASIALSSTAVFAQYVKIPIISASGINPLTAPIAISYGASGIGIGSFFCSFSNTLALARNITAIMSSLSSSVSTDYDICDFVFSYTRPVVVLIPKADKLIAKNSISVNNHCNEDQVTSH